MNACRDFDLLLPLRAAGALDPAEAARLEAHLADCAACRKEAAADAEALALAKLPPLSEADRRAVADVPRRALAALRSADIRRARWKRAGFGVAVAAAAVLAALSPALRARIGPAAPAPLSATTEVAWEGPDLDTTWEDAGALDLDTPSADGESFDTDTALAVLDQ